MPNERITLSINLSLLDKSKFIKGEKGTYCDLILYPTPDSQYGAYMVKQKSSKEEAINKTQTPIIGNGKFQQKKEFKPSKPLATTPQGDPAEDW